MSTETTFMIEGKGACGVPESLNPDGKDLVYGLSFAYVSDFIDTVFKDLGFGSVYDYYVDLDKINDEVADEVGDPETSEEYDRFEALVDERLPWYSSKKALKHFKAVKKWIEENEEDSRRAIHEKFKGNYKGTLWDLEVLIEVLREAAAESRGFHIDVG